MLHYDAKNKNDYEGDKMMIIPRLFNEMRGKKENILTPRWLHRDQRRKRELSEENKKEIGG